jgi:mannose-1-phosphate guanylyltransferase/phosphomannomutase
MEGEMFMIKGMILGAGEGTRLRPLTSNHPKPMMPVLNRPIMEHIIRLLKRHNITELYCNLYYLPDEIQNYFEDGSSLGVHISFKVEERLPGTAGGVKNLEEHFDDTFVVISGDAITDIDLTSAINFHKERGAIATIILAHVENPLEFGVVITNEEGRIVRFLEKPGWSEVFSDTVNTGIYILEPKVFDFIPKGKDFDFSKDLFPLLLEEQQPLYGFIADGYWCDVGNIESYMKVHYDALSGKVKLDIPGQEIAPGVWIGKNVDIPPSASIKGPVLIGDNTQIKDLVKIREFTVIGDNTLIDTNALLLRSIVWSNSYIGESSTITNAVIGKKVIIKSRVRVGENAVVSDECFIDEGVLIKPGVKVWPSKSIEKGTVLSSSLVWGTGWRKLYFSNGTIFGLANIEINPEFAAKLGTAFGGILEKGTEVVASRDANRSSRMIKRAIVSGIASAGINVVDLQTTPPPVAHYFTRTEGLSGGVQVSTSPFDPRSVDIKFFDSLGITINRDTERKIETLFLREDARRTYLYEIGEIRYAPRAVESYIAGFLSKINIDAIRNVGKKIVIDYSFGTTSMVLPSILGKLGCEVVSINAFIDERKLAKTREEFLFSINQLSQIVTTLRADLGILLDSQGEKIFIVDEKGSLISDEDLAYILAFLAIRTQARKDVAFPIYMPRVFEEGLRHYGGNIVWTKSSDRAIMEASTRNHIVFASDGRGGAIFPQFQFTYDGMFGFVKLLEFLSTENIPLSQLRDLVPPYSLVKSKVNCPWEHKGRVMRELLEKKYEKEVDYTEGIRILTDDGWFLVLSDPNRPEFHIYAEGKAIRQAERLAQEAIEMISSIIPKE